MRNRHGGRGRLGVVRPEAVWLALLAGGLGLGAGAMGTIPSTLRDFFLPGTQPNTLTDAIVSPTACATCHGGYDLDKEPYRPWAASLMGQASRDPVFHAALAIANQDASFAGDFCLRCHVASGWLAGRSTPTDGSSLLAADHVGVSCNLCHRMVDPVYHTGNPSVDQDILAGLASPPPNPHTGDYVIDPMDRRRGPYDLGSSFTYHAWLQSPFHRTSNLCATCHDVSNPMYVKQPNGTYAMGPLDQEHPTGSKHDMFPVERTYSEWSQSQFAQGPVDMGGRFGGNITAVSTCQDCHMPKTTGKGCRQGFDRSDLPRHHFNGGNTWVLQAVRNLYSDSETGLAPETVADSIARTTAMLQAASDTELTVAGPLLTVRITNQSAHKLPTGYPEGRRMWINVQYRDAQGQLIAERGGYDASTAVLSEAGTKVYESKTGIDAAVSAATGIPQGPGFHFALANTIFFDNRIPPRGFTNAGFASVQASPIGYSYADGQYWDDTAYLMPDGATSARVTVYYQSTAREYIEFLRDANTTNTKGQIAYDQWVATGKSAPVALDIATANFPGVCYANCDGSSAAPVLNVADFTCFLQKFAGGSPYANCDGSTAAPALNVADFTCFLQKFAGGCP
jgi:hypothetical protein